MNCEKRNMRIVHSIRITKTATETQYKCDKCDNIADFMIVNVLTFNATDTNIEESDRSKFLCKECYND